MASELEPRVRQLFQRFDSLDFGSIRSGLASGAQGVDEISRRWLRDADQIQEYFSQLAPVLSDVHSDLSDIHEILWGDTGVVTLWLEQSYVLEGVSHHVSAPTTVLFHREDGAWKTALIHSVPLPETS